jgi:uncharacterized alpha-E superfamily protein
VTRTGGRVLARSWSGRENSARIVDVKYHVLLPRGQSDVGGHLDYYQWGAVLGAVSAFRAYHWVYRDRLEPSRVAELMILRPELPRSLLSCGGPSDLLTSHESPAPTPWISTAKVTTTRARHRNRTRRTPKTRRTHILTIVICPVEVARFRAHPHRAAHRFDALRSTTIEQIFETGLHEFLTACIESLNVLGTDVRREYFSGKGPRPVPLLRDESGSTLVTRSAAPLNSSYGGASLRRLYAPPSPFATGEGLL